MSQILTTTHKAREHYEHLLAEAQAFTTAPVLFPVEVTPGTDLEITNVEIGERHESCEIGPFANNLYLRVRAGDLAAFFKALERQAADGIAAVIDARDDKARAEMVECPGCRTRIAPDELSCGYPRCERIAAMEVQL